MRFGLSDQQYSILENLALKPLSAKKAQVYVFGSRARGTHHPFSDLDLLYVEDSQHPISPSVISKIKDDLENSNLTIKVDLVSDKLLAVSYRVSVEADKVRVL